MWQKPSTIRIHEKWDPRIGKLGARYFGLYFWAMFLSVPGGLALFVGLFAQAKFRSPIGQVLAGLVISFMVVDLALLWLAPVLARRAASKKLGIKVTFRNAPPYDVEEYKSWCRRNHVEPFSADK
jgi:hypothetical protein